MMKIQILMEEMRSLIDVPRKTNPIVDCVLCHVSTSMGISAKDEKKYYVSSSLLEDG